MAERRMFAKKIVTSARFLRMPNTAQLLYFHLGMQADDDGVVEAFTVLRTSGLTENDLEVLVNRQFVAILNDDLVSYITDWKKNNLIRQDRYQASIYAKLLQDFLNNENGLPVVNQRETQVRLGKVSEGKESEGEEREEERTPALAYYGQYKNVRLTIADYDSIMAEFPNGLETLERLSDYIRTHGKNYPDHAFVIRKWAKEDAEKRTERRSRTSGNPCDGVKLNEYIPNDKPFDDVNLDDIF